MRLHLSIQKAIYYALSVIILLTSFSLNAQNQNRIYRWKMATSWPANFIPLSTVAVNFAKYVNTFSDGKLIVQVDDATKHKAPLGILDMVKGGQYEMGHTATYYYKGIDPTFQLMTTFPFGMTAPELYGWFYYGGGLELMNEFSAEHRVITLPGGNTAMQMGGWFNKEINTLDDLKSLKMRIPGLAGEVMAELGVSVVNIPAAELYVALERKTIDAIEWVGPAMDISLGLYKITPYYYTAWQEPGPESNFFINKEEFEKLPKNLQDIVLLSARLAAYDLFVEMTHLNGIALEEIKKNSDIRIRTFSPEILSALRDTTEKILDREAQDNPTFKKMLDSQNEYLTKARRWTLISDYLYLETNQ